MKTKLNPASTEERARLEKEQEETRWKAWELGVDPDLAPRPGSSSCNLPPVALDLYSRLQSAASVGAAGGPREEKEREKGEADAEPDRFSFATHAPFLDAARLYERLLRRKRQRVGATWSSSGARWSGFWETTTGARSACRRSG